MTAFRPFPGPQIVKALKHLKAFSVLEKLDVPLGQSNPLTAEIKASFADAMSGHPDYPKIDRIPTVYSGCGGLGSRDVRPGHIVAIFENMRKKDGKRFFTLNVKHPTALPLVEDPDVRPKGSFSMRGHSVGGYGSITTNKIIASISSDLFGLNAQAYPRYGAEKKGLPTSYYLTLAHDVIRPHCEQKYVEFVPLHDVKAFRTGNPLAGLAAGRHGVHPDGQDDARGRMGGHPGNAPGRLSARRSIRVLALDTAKIAEEVATRPDLVQRMQGIVLLGVFLRYTPFLKEASGRQRGAVRAGREVAAQVLRRPRREGDQGQPGVRAPRVQRGIRDTGGSYRERAVRGETGGRPEDRERNGYEQGASRAR